jgi:hypothetical protein
MIMIDIKTAYSVFREISDIDIRKPITPNDVYWTALDAERDGYITVGEMDSICINRDSIVELFVSEGAEFEAEEKLQAEVHQAQSDYWNDFEAGLI